MLNSYSDYYYKRYLARGCSPAHLLCIFCAYLIVALPFYFSFAGKNFWLDTSSRPLTLSYNYTGYYAAQVNYQNGGAFSTHEYSNIPGNTMTYPTNFALSILTTGEQSLQTAKLTLTGYGAVEVTSINVIMYYSVWFEELGREQVCGLMWNMAGNVVGGTIGGSFRYKSTSPISGIQSNEVVNLPPYYPNLVAPSSFSVLANELILTSLLLQPSFSHSLITDTTNTLGTTRTISLKAVKQRSVIVNYYPSLLETLKFKYSRFIAFALIAFVVFGETYRMYVREGLVDCQAKTEQVKVY